MLLYCAPMEGLTGYVFRNAHRDLFGGVDKYFTPFVSPGQNRRFTPREMGDLLPEHNRDIPLVPQLLTNRAEDFLWASEALAELGYREVNLNLGCPSGTVTAKGKGAGFLTRPEALDAFFEEIFRRAPLPVSVKTRLGKSDPAEFDRLMEIYRRYPISELIIHPRLIADKYRGEPRMRPFEQALADCPLPVGFNGNLFGAEKIRSFEEAHPAVRSAMLGRGLVSNPGLARCVKTGRMPEKAELWRFYERLRADYLSVLPGEKTILFRMKEHCLYMGRLFPNSEKQLKRVRKATRIADFDAAVRQLFDECELTPKAEFLPPD